jgi:large subunit ribosomal protein L15
MKINQLAPVAGARKRRHRVGRGMGSGWGKTSGRGSNGQNARSGGPKAVGFEGGQMPITQKMPKRGFHNVFKIKYDVVNLKDLGRFASGTQVNPEVLAKAGLIRKSRLVKVLGDGDAPKQIAVQAHRFSKSAVEKLTAAGGKTEVLK